MLLKGTGETFPGQLQSQEHVASIYPLKAPGLPIGVLDTSLLPGRNGSFALWMSPEGKAAARAWQCHCPRVPVRGFSAEQGKHSLGGCALGAPWGGSCSTAPADLGLECLLPPEMLLLPHALPPHPAPHRDHAVQGGLY